MSRRPFSFSAFPSTTSGTLLGDILVRLFSALQGAIPNGPSSRTLTQMTTLKAGLYDEHALLRCDATLVPFPVTLPPLRTSQDTRFTLKKIDASANAVTVTAAGVDTIEGAATKVLGARWASVTLHACAAEWEILSTT